MKKLKKILLIVFSFLLLVSSFSPIIEHSFAMDPKKEFSKKATEYAGEDEKSFFSNLKRDRTLYKSGKNDSIESVMSYLFRPGGYINYVKFGSLGGDGIDKTVVSGSYGDSDRKVCFRSDEPNNLLNHNCDVPSFMTALVQTFASIGNNSSGIKNGQVTSAVAGWGFGVPIGIPNNEVPVDDSARNDYKYSALELFGYNLQYSDYLGEWDHIDVATSSRVFANMGFWAKVGLAGLSVFNSTVVGVTTFFNEVSKDVFNLANWFKAFSVALNAGVAAGLWTYVDSSDLNVIATHGWRRQTFGNTLYNGYYITDKQVKERYDAFVKQTMKSKLLAHADKIPNLKELLEVEISTPDWPNFVFRDRIETEDSRKIREPILEKNKAAKTTVETPPPPVYETEKEQLAKWLEQTTQKEFIAKGEALNIKCTDKEPEKWQEFVDCWNSGWDRALQEIMKDSDNLKLLKEISKEVAEELKQENPLLDLTKGISHYACANEEGVPFGSHALDWPLIYTAENTESEEFLNPGCSPVRPPIKGGLMGNGDLDYFLNPSDTRYVMFLKMKESKPEDKSFLDVWRTISSFSIKTLNTLMTVAYSNIFEMLGIDKAIETTITTLYNSIFFPLGVIGIALSTVWLFWKAYVLQGARAFLQSFVMLLVTYMLGITLLSRPAEVVKFIDEYPSMAENFIIDVLNKEPREIDKDKETEICRVTGLEQTGARYLQCVFWELAIFQPWLYGQWGTNYEDLEFTNMTNSNKDLVGVPDVYMGAGIHLNNWALYQLKLMKSGTITTADPIIEEGVTRKAMYKLVDLQAGPNYGQNSDGRFFVQWSGANKDRTSYQIKSAVISVAFLVIFGGMLLSKIELSFTFGIYLFMLPFMAVMGLFPGTRGKFRDYLFTLLNILIKRVAIVAVMSITFLMMTMATRTIKDYNYIFLFILMLAVATKMYYKDLINLFTASTNSASEFLGTNVGDLRNAISQANFPGKTLDRKARTLASGLGGATAGAVGGAAAGILASMKDGATPYRRKNNVIMSSIKEGASHGWNTKAGRTFREERKKGFGFADNMEQANRAVIEDIQKEMTNPTSEIHQNIVNMRVITQNRLAELQFLEKNVNEQIDKHTKGNNEQLGKWNVKHYKFVKSNQDNFNQIQSNFAQLKLAVGENASYEDLLNHLKKHKSKDKQLKSYIKLLAEKENILKSVPKIDLSVLNQLEEERKVIQAKIHKTAIALNTLENFDKPNYLNSVPEMTKALKSYKSGDKVILTHNGEKVGYKLTDKDQVDIYAEVISQNVLDNTENPNSIFDDVKDTISKSKALTKGRELLNNSINPDWNHKEIEWNSLLTDKVDYTDKVTGATSRMTGTEAYIRDLIYEYDIEDSFDSNKIEGIANVFNLSESVNPLEKPKETDYEKRIPKYTINSIKDGFVETFGNQDPFGQQEDHKANEWSDIDKRDYYNVTKENSSSKPKFSLSSFDEVNDPLENDDEIKKVIKKEEVNYNALLKNDNDFIFGNDDSKNEKESSDWFDIDKRDYYNTEQNQPTEKVKSNKETNNIEKNNIKPSVPENKSDDWHEIDKRDYYELDTHKSNDSKTKSTDLLDDNKFDYSDVDNYEKDKHTKSSAPESKSDDWYEIDKRDYYESDNHKNNDKEIVKQSTISETKSANLLEDDKFDYSDLEKYDVEKQTNNFENSYDDNKKQSNLENNNPLKQEKIKYVENDWDNFDEVNYYNNESIKTSKETFYENNLRRSDDFVENKSEKTNVKYDVNNDVPFTQNDSYKSAKNKTFSHNMNNNKFNSLNNDNSSLNDDVLDNVFDNLSNRSSEQQFDDLLKDIDKER